jgi:hypothetical protein
MGIALLFAILPLQLRVSKQPRKQPDLCIARGRISTKITCVYKIKHTLVVGKAVMGNTTEITQSKNMND